SRSQSECRERAASRALVALADLSRDLRPRPKEPRLDGAVRKLQSLADLLVGEPVEVAKHQDLGQVFGDLGQRPEEHLCPLFSKSVRRRILLGPEQRRDRFVADEAKRLLALATAVAVDAKVSGERDDPGDQRIASVVSVEALEDLQKDLLRQFLRVLPFQGE